MDTRLKLRALGLALTLVTAAAGTGWALQVPLTAVVRVDPAQALRFAAPADAPSLALPAQLQAAVPPGGGAPAPARAADVAGFDGIEAMSATGGASARP